MDGIIENFKKSELRNFSAVKQGAQITSWSMTGKKLRSEHNFTFAIQLIFPCKAKYHETCFMKYLFICSNFTDSTLKYINKKEK